MPKWGAIAGGVESFFSSYDIQKRRKQREKEEEQRKREWRMRTMERTGYAPETLELGQRMAKRREIEKGAKKKEPSELRKAYGMKAKPREITPLTGEEERAAKAYTSLLERTKKKPKGIGVSPIVSRLNALEKLKADFEFLNPGTPFPKQKEIDAHKKRYQQLMGYSWQQEVGKYGSPEGQKKDFRKKAGLIPD